MKQSQRGISGVLAADVERGAAIAVTMTGQGLNTGKNF